jgi:hypothetical protein
VSELEVLEERVRQDGTLIERLGKCAGMIGVMCKEGRPPQMSIPVRWNDEDFYISTTITDAIAAVERGVEVEVYGRNGHAKEMINGR